MGASPCFLLAVLKEGFLVEEAVEEGALPFQAWAAAVEEEEA